MQIEQYLEMVQDWVDPYPAPVVEKIENLYVVRDDLLEAGSKMRFIDCLIRNDDGEEWVFGGANKVGWGPISLTAVCNRYGKKATFFMAKRKEPTWHQQKVLELGGTIHWVENGMLNVTKSRARKYQEEKPDTRRVLPLGLEHPTVIASIVKVAQSLNVQPSEIWTVASSGTLNRGLQLAFPDVDCYAIQVGHKMTDYEKGRAKVLISPYKYDRAVKPEDAPPYPSEPFYDAKVWSFVRDMAKKDALVWNVA